MNLAVIFIAGQIWNEGITQSEKEKECRENEGKEKEYATPIKKQCISPHINTSTCTPTSIKIKPQLPQSMTPIVTNIDTPLDSAYNHNIDTQFVEDVMSDIELNWSAVEREDSIRSHSVPRVYSNSLSPINPHHYNQSHRLHPLHPTSVDTKYIIQKYSEIEQFHSDVTISCESDLETRSISTTPAPVDPDEQMIDDLMDDLEGDFAHELSLNPVTAVSRCMENIGKYVVQKYSENHGSIFFDRISVTASNQKILILDSKALSHGKHEWAIQILKSDVDVIEIGVIGSNEIECIEVNEYGIQNTTECKARCVFGNELSSFTTYIASSNEDESKSQYQDLSGQRRIGWCVYDTITVQLDLEQSIIRFLLNDKPCGQMMRLQRDATYYPVISFAGHCQFDLR